MPHPGDVICKPVLTIFNTHNLNSFRYPAKVNMFVKALSSLILLLSFSHQVSSLEEFSSLNETYSDGILSVYGTNLDLKKPFDHVIYHKSDTTLELQADLQILYLAEMFGIGNYMTSKRFIEAYSDHNPIRFLVKLTKDRD